MEKDNDNKTTEKPIEMQPLDIIRECGRLKYPIDKTVNVLCAKFRMEKTEIYSLLTTLGTEENETYQSGLDLGDFEIDSAIRKKAAEGDTFALEAYDNILLKKAIGDAVTEKFFPKDDQE